MKNMTQSIPFLLIAVFVLMSIILFLVMGRDKALSKTRRRRVPEATLFLLAVLGGALGGVLGMQIFRHKTQHMKFMIGFPLIALIQWGVVILMFLSD